MTLRQRQTPLRSKAIRNASRGEECTLQIFGVCIGGTETTVLAQCVSYVRERQASQHKSMSDAITKASTLQAEVTRLTDALRKVREAILDPINVNGAVIDTVWMPTPDGMVPIETLIDFIDAALTASIPDSGEGWQDISTAPRDGTSFMSWGPDEIYAKPWHYAVVRWGSGAWVREGDDYDLIAHPTHWRPLPTPPAS